jgi:Zinc knuckle
VIDELGNDYTLGNNNYPRDIPGVMTMLSNRRGGGGNKKIVDYMKDGVVYTSTSFGQTEFKTKKRCYRCGKKGHLANRCTEKDGTEGKNSFSKGQGNPWANKSDSDSVSSGPKGWFK